MYGIREKVVGEETEKRLKSHGLTLSVSEDRASGHPLEGTGIVFVGGDTHRNYYLERFSGDMSAFVRAFCKDILECRADDLIWKTVYSKDITDRKNYSLISAGEIGGKGSYREQGFIYITKDQVKAELDVHIVGTKVKKEILSRFEGKIAHLNAWNEGSVYRASVMTDDGGVYDTWHGLYTYKKSAEAQINLLIDQIVDSIDQDIDICRFALTFKVNEMRLPIDVSPTEHLINHVKSKFGFTPSFGAINHNRKTDILTTNMLGNVMPLFDELVNKDVFESMQKNANALIDDERFPSMTSSSIIEMMESAEHYTVWTPLMIHALMKTITEGVSGVDLISAEIAECETKEVS